MYPRLRTPELEVQLLLTSPFPPQTEIMFQLHTLEALHRHSPAREAPVKKSLEAPQLLEVRILVAGL